MISCRIWRFWPASIGLDCSLGSDQNSRMIRLVIGIERDCCIACHCLFDGDRQCGAGDFLLRKAGDTARPNIFILLIDTLRADALGCYGKSGAELRQSIAWQPTEFFIEMPTRRLRGLGRPWLLYGQDSILHASGSRGNKRRKGRIASQECHHSGGISQGRRYLTCGLNTNPVIMPQFGLHQGFDLYYTFPIHPSATACDQGHRRCLSRITRPIIILMERH